jgi:hypothetical protein
MGSLFSPTSILRKISEIRHPHVRDILSGFEGVVAPGEMLREYFRLSPHVLYKTSFFQSFLANLGLDVAPSSRPSLISVGSTILSKETFRMIHLPLKKFIIITAETSLIPQRMTFTSLP